MNVGIPWVAGLILDFLNVLPLALSEMGNSQIGENNCPEILRRVRRGVEQAMGFLDSTGDIKINLDGTKVEAIQKYKTSQQQMNHIISNKLKE